jgi:formylglycine-generating enzyme required for sulfatase activity
MLPPNLFALLSVLPAIRNACVLLGAAAAFAVCLTVQAETPPPPRVDSIVRTSQQFRLTISSQLGLTNAVQYSDSFSEPEWITLTNRLVTQTPYVALDPAAAPAGRRFYRVIAWYPDGAPTNMAYIPEGYFTMGGTLSLYGEVPVHSVNTSPYYIDRTEVPKSLWNVVYAWAVANGYQFDHAGAVKSNNSHPVHSVDWYDAVKWCNARSEREGRVAAYYTDGTQTNVYRSGRLTNADASFVKWDAGYRLPTEAEWEKACRGGINGRTYPWGNSISTANANYSYHPSYNDGVRPYTSPVGSFPPNGYGLHDVIGNVWEWCWDYYSTTYYSISPLMNPRGPSAGGNHVARGGAWDNGATDTRCASRSGSIAPTGTTWNLGLRAVLGSAP